MRTTLTILRRVTILFLCTTLVMLSPGARQFVLAQSRPDPRQQPLATLDAYLATLQDLRAGIDRTLFDVDALALELAFEEPEVIVDWVRGNVYFEQYPGLLRGAQGTLMSRSGNALDQAALLVALLEGAGYDARIVGGTLTEAEAATLVDQMMVPPAAPSPGLDVDVLAESLTALAGVVGVPAADALALLDDLAGIGEAAGPSFAGAQGDAAVLLELLDSNGVALGDPDDLPAIVEEARAYHWVQYREGGADAWLDAHPAIRRVDLSGFAPALTETLEEGIPERLQHRLRFEVIVEVMQDEDFETKPLMAAWERPSAELAGVPLTYTNLADGFLPFEAFAEGQTSIAEGLEQTNFFFPLFNGALPVGAQAFDTNGFLLDPAVASDPAAGLVREQAEAVEGVTGMLEGLGGGLGGEEEAEGPEEPREIFTLTAQWLDYTLIAPNGTETRHRKPVFDLVGDEHRGGEDAPARVTAASDPLEVATALTSSYTFMVATGELAPGFILDRMLARIANMVPLMKANLTGEYDAAALEGVDVSWLGHLKLYGLFDDGASGLINYRPEPTLAVYRQSLDGEEAGALELDVIANTRRAFDVVEDRLVADPGALLRTGVWETWAEQLVLPQVAVDRSEPNVVSASHLLEDASAQGVPLVVVTPEESAGLDELELPEAALREMRKDLAGGFVVVAPQRLTDTRPAALAAWWRVDPASGETLGMLETGSGGALQPSVELMILVSVIGGAVVGYLTYSSCIGSFSPVAGAADDGSAKVLGCAICGAIAGALAGVLIFTAWSAIGSQYAVINGVRMKVALGGSGAQVTSAAVAALAEVIVAALCNALGAADI